MEIKDINDVGKRFNVTHKRIAIKKDDYLNSVNYFHEPYSQTVLQHFMVDYLEKTHDEGLVGLVRYKEEEEEIIIDAAVRYLE